jgi:hypothetical protein
MPKSAAATRNRPTPETRQPKAPAPTFDACADRWEGERDTEALKEAGRRFGGDIEAEMAAIQAGTHPLQQRQRRAGR